MAAYSNDIDRRLAFMAEWYQREAGITRNFQLIYHSAGNTVEIFDIRRKKVFLRPTQISHLSERDFFLGSKIEILDRQFALVKYADEATAKIKGLHSNRTFIILKNKIIADLGQVLRALGDSHFHVERGLRVRLSAAQVRDFLGCKNQDDSELAVLQHELAEGPIIGFQLSSDNALDKLKSCQQQAKECNNSTLLKPLVELFKNEEFLNGIYCAQHYKEAQEHTEYFFGPKSELKSTLVLKNSTLCIVKPHAIREGNLGKIITDITENDFEITGLRVLLVDRTNADEFLNVYQTVTEDYRAMAAQLSCGVCMALELVCKDPNKTAYPEFRKYCGPKDPDYARFLRPVSLRAKFGVTKVLNAVHTTDMGEDTLLELQYIFKIIK